MDPNNPHTFVRGNVANRNSYVGTHKRRRRQRSFQIDRWRNEVEAAGGARTAARSNWKSCGARGASNSNRVYAEIETGDGVPLGDNPGQSGQLWRSEDGGDTWALVSSDRDIRGRTHYYTREEISPSDENEVYFFRRRFRTPSMAVRSARDLRAGRRQPRNVDRSNECGPHGSGE